MTESCSEGLLGTWAPPECPFKIAYSLRALDDIRLAVIDAFFSLPRGGAEIGGILLGKRDPEQVTVLDYVALDCEHAFGPSFTLSPRDLAHLSVLLEEARKNTPDLQPVGWYHSHTRSDIFLSEADLEIHKRYFSSPWQIALVLKPHTFQPARGGFFFRAADGTFRIDATCREFVLDPLPIRPIPSGIVPPPVVETGSTMRLDPSPAGRVITMPSTAVPDPAAGPELAGESGPDSGLAPQPPASELGPQLLPAPPDPAAEPAISPGPVLVPNPDYKTPPDGDAIHFPDLSPRPRWRVTALLGLAALLAIGAFGFGTHRVWLPRIWHGAVVSAPTSSANSLGLVLSDHDGQLRIGWDRKAPAIESATRGTLEISAGDGIPSATQLDAAQLQSGSFTYMRETEKVDVVLSVEGPNGELGHESVGFLGKLPEPAGRSADDAAARQRDALAVEVERLKADLMAQVAENQQLLQYKEQRGNMVADLDRLRNQVNNQAARIKELERALKPKDDQIAKLRNDLNVQISHNRVLAQSLLDTQVQLRLQQKRRLSNQNPDTSKQ